MINAAGIALLKEFERGKDARTGKLLPGAAREAYDDGGGVWTIGWGHTGRDVRPGLRWTQLRCDAALMDDTLEVRF